MAEPTAPTGGDEVHLETGSVRDLKGVAAQSGRPAVDVDEMNDVIAAAAAESISPMPSSPSSTPRR
ncbi:MAG: hypothetical protein ACRCSN_06135 [Dermatophilaceae bacterium]